ncbi:hypothetical protein BDV59DRAFT_199535 [Aspergillus ambiguus]|uniref:uncharacterized protein n=1 Tax=Aspergillus ambiguus TaxID=176160 RepID=UPI003CCD4331
MANNPDTGKPVTPRGRRAALPSRIEQTAVPSSHWAERERADPSFLTVACRLSARHHLPISGDPVHGLRAAFLRANTKPIKFTAQLTAAPS